MPSLRSLYINLQEEDQVDLLMRLLPDLEYLNGLPVDRDALDEDPIVEGSPNNNNDPALAIVKEASANVGDQVRELPSEQEQSSGYNSP